MLLGAMDLNLTARYSCKLAQAERFQAPPPYLDPDHV